MDAHVARSTINTLLYLTFAAIAPGVYADVFTVNSVTDAIDSNLGDTACLSSAGECTLRAAIQESNALSGNDSITLPGGNYVLTVPLANPIGESPNDDLDVLDNLTINGAGAGSTFIDGNDATRVMNITLDGLLVCDSSGDKIIRYKLATGGFAQTVIPTGSGGLDFPGALVRKPNGGDVFVGGFTSGVNRYSRDGSFLGSFISSASAPGVTDIAFGPGGHLYVTKFQPGAGSIQRFNGATGAFIDTFVGIGSGGLGLPNSIVFRGSHLYVTSVSPDAVLRYNANTGAFVDTFVPAFSGGLSTARGLTFGADGRLYVASEANDRILRYNGTTGAFIDTFVAAGSGGLDGPTDISFGPDGNLYVISRHTGQVLRYNGTTGAFIDVFVDDGDGGLGFAACLSFESGIGVGPTVNISGVTIRNGRGGSFVQGGGVSISQGSTLTLARSVVENNDSNEFGGGISNGGTLNVRRSTIRGNTLPLGGCGGQTSSGGGILNFGGAVADIDKSTISGNSACRGGAIRNAGGDLRINNSTLSGNRADARGGALMNFGDAAIAFSTITDNQANVGGGDNGLTFGGGIYNAGNLNMGNSILAGNTDNRSRFQPGYSPDCWSKVTAATPDAAALTSFRGNVVGISNTNCNIADTITGDTAFDQIGIVNDSVNMPLDPQLSALASNGGPTRTHALQSDSPAIDKGTGSSSGTGNSFFNCSNRDQRDFVRPVNGDGVGGAQCDAGAFEFGAIPGLVISDIVLQLLQTLRPFLPPRLLDALIGRLENIESAATDGNHTKACAGLQSLNDELRNQAGRKIPVKQMEKLLSGVQKTRVMLACV